MSWEQENILVTGGCGMIGSHLSRRLTELDANVRIVDDLSRGSVDNIKDFRDKVDFHRMDLTSSVSANMAVSDKDIVVMFACVLGGIEELMRVPAILSYRNLMVDLNTIEACRIKGVKKVLYASTAMVYGKECKLPCKEDDPELGKSFYTVYGRCKYLMEHVLKSYSEQYGMDIKILRFFNVYSEFEEFNLKSHVIPALIYKTLTLKQDPLVVWGTGEQRRSFTYASDIVSGILLALRKAPNCVPINLGSPYGIPIRTIAEKILFLCDKDFKRITFDTNKPEGASDMGADISRSKELLGWDPRVSLDDGLRRTIEGYKRRVVDG